MSWGGFRVVVVVLALTLLSACSGKSSPTATPRSSSTNSSSAPSASVTSTTSGASNSGDRSRFCDAVAGYEQGTASSLDEVFTELETAAPGALTSAVRDFETIARARIATRDSSSSDDPNGTVTNLARNFQVSEKLLVSFCLTGGGTSPGKLADSAVCDALEQLSGDTEDVVVGTLDSSGNNPHPEQGVSRLAQDLATLRAIEQAAPPTLTDLVRGVDAALDTAIQQHTSDAFTAYEDALQSAQQQCGPGTSAFSS